MKALIALRKRGIDDSITYQTQQRVPDFRRYEILVLSEVEVKDHLGNVRTVISDVKNPYVKSGSVSTWTYLADVKNISNMYPYGKSYGTNAIYNKADDYKYGFNGMEKEKNFSETGDITDFGARVFDANFPSFGSPDPLETKFSYQSTYIISKNNPIRYLDVNGEHYHDYKTKFFNSENSIIVMKYENMTNTHQNRLNVLINAGYPINHFDDVEFYSVVYEGPKFFKSDSPNQKPNIITLQKGGRPFNPNNGRMPTTLASTNTIRIKPLIGLALVAEAVSVIRNIWDWKDAPEMKEAKMQKLTLQNKIPEVLDKANENGLLEETSFEELDHIINLLMYGESKGASKKNIDTYFKIVDQIIQPQGVTLIENSSGSSSSDATSVSTPIYVPNKILRDKERKKDAK